jgi:hypothetical protein
LITKSKPEKPQYDQPEWGSPEGHQP